MKLKNQLVNKELSIELDKLGAKEESLYWHKIPNKKCRNGSVASIVEYREESKWFDYYRAYSGTEIGDILPTYIVFKGNTLWLCIGRSSHDDNWACYYGDGAGNFLNFKAYDNIEANSRALMLIYLFKNKLIKL